MTQRVVLIGMMGVGKTTIGRALASRLTWAYLDSDEQVREATGRSVQQIFLSDGPDVLHRFERDALIAALASATPSVVAVAGGAIMDSENRVLLTGEPRVVWLRASIDTMAERIGAAGERPYFGADRVATLKALYGVRRPLYGHVAKVTIDVDDLAPEEIVERILATMA